MEWQNLMDMESGLRLGAFALSLLVFASLEALLPKKQYPSQRGNRWLTNYGVVVIDTIFLRLAFPVLAVSVAATWNTGLFHWLSLPFALELGLSVLLLDLIIYFQHRIFHRVPLLWRLHRVHHLDTAIDTSTALRFHPIEIALSMGIKIVMVMTLGLAPESVIVFEILLSSSAIFNHANWNLKKWDQPLQKILVTPDMHRIHHSVIVKETNSNYGFCLSVWDRWFGTYTENASKRTDEMQIGLKEFRTPKDQRLDQLMLNPFR